MPLVGLYPFLHYEQQRFISETNVSMPLVELYPFLLIKKGKDKGLSKGVNALSRALSISTGLLS